jgi:hypothetical protein
MGKRFAGLPKPMSPKTKAQRDGLPPQVVPAKKNASGGDGVRLSIVIPPETMIDLKTQAAPSSTVRVLVLKALDKAGYVVPKHELTDRRRKA